MFRAVRLLRGVSPFTIFLMDQKSNPSFKGVSIKKRAVILSKMYKSLPEKQLRDLRKRAEKHPSFSKKEKKTGDKKKYRKSAFSLFVKSNYGKVKALNPRKRFGALSQLYELQKPLGIEQDLIKFTEPFKKKALTVAATEAAIQAPQKAVKPAGAVAPRVSRDDVKVVKEKSKVAVKAVSKVAKATPVAPAPPAGASVEKTVVKSAKKSVKQAAAAAAATSSKK